MKKISLLFIAFIFIILSCSKEQNVVVKDDPISPKSEISVRIKARKTNYVKRDTIKISQDEIKAHIEGNKNLLSLLNANDISIDDIFNPKLQDRSNCYGDCYYYQVLADPNDSGYTTMDEVDIVTDYLLTLVTRSQAIAMGYPYIDDPALLDCLPCDGLQDCNKLTVADLVYMLHMMNNPPTISCEL